MIYNFTLPLPVRKSKSSSSADLIMNTLNLNLKHLVPFQKAALNFANAKHILLSCSGPFRLDRSDFFLTPYPFSGLPVVFLAGNDTNGIVYAGLSYNNTCLSNYLNNAPDGSGTVKEDWPVGNPDYLVFYCLSDQPVKRFQEPYHTWLHELRAIFNSIISTGQSATDCLTVKTLMLDFDLLGQYPVLEGTPAGVVMLSWQDALTKGQPVHSQADHADKYLHVVGFDEHPVIQRFVIRSITDPSYRLQLEDCHDLAFIANLPIVADKGLSHRHIAMHLLECLSKVTVSKDEV